MRSVDLLNPFKQHTPLVWGSRNLIASIAGLGDLMLHLPLLAALVERLRSGGVAVEVALRPAHAEIGRRLGWAVLPLENPLQSLFNGKATVPELAGAWKKSVAQLRTHPYDLCLDLSGSAFNSLLFKRGRVTRLASRITRGGRSLVDHALDHAPYENEYLYRTRLALSLDVIPDLSVYRRLVAPAPVRDEIILAVTTSCRWRNWRIRNFAAVAAALPGRHFVLVGHAEEIAAEDRADFEKLQALPRVENLVGRLSVMELIERIASARFVVADDSSAAHIANAFERSGCVLFGPVDSTTWAMPGGLEVFHDTSCPYYPCVQWHCKNSANWCMEKISPAAVISRLEA